MTMSPTAAFAGLVPVSAAASAQHLATSVSSVRRRPDVASASSSIFVRNSQHRLQGIPCEAVQSSRIYTLPWYPVTIISMEASSVAQSDPAAPGEGTAEQVEAVKDIYAPFWEYATKVLEERLGPEGLAAYPIPDGFVHKEAITGKGKRAALVTTDSYAYQTQKLRQIRTAHVRGGKALQVLNFVIFPHMNYRVPFFGADLVTLPGGHLIALDMQPLFHTDDYRNEFTDPLKPIFEKHKPNLPWGGDFPEEAARFFSPCFLWSRPSEDQTVETHVFEAFKDYLHAYLDFVHDAKPVTDPAELEAIRESQVAYLRYRAEKDPARGMFLRFYGEDWTEEYIHGFLFDLERKIESGEYNIPLH